MWRRSTLATSRGPSPRSCSLESKSSSSPGAEYHSDWQGASVCVVELAGRDLDLQGEIGDLAFGRARRILEENWEAVAGLATALMASGKLERQQVEELLKGVEDAG